MTGCGSGQSWRVAVETRWLSLLNIGLAQVVDVSSVARIQLAAPPTLTVPVPERPYISGVGGSGERHWVAVACCYVAEWSGRSRPIHAGWPRVRDCSL